MKIALTRFVAVPLTLFLALAGCSTPAPTANPQRRDLAAIKGACDHIEMGNLTGLLKKIEPAVTAARDVPGERNSKNEAFVEAVCEANMNNLGRNPNLLTRSET